MARKRNNGRDRVFPLIKKGLPLALLLFFSVSFLFGTVSADDCPELEVTTFNLPPALLVGYSTPVGVSGTSDSGEAVKYFIDFGDGTITNSPPLPSGTPWFFHNIYTTCGQFTVQVAVELADQPGGYVCVSPIETETIQVVDPDAPAPCPEITEVSMPTSVKVNNNFRTYVTWIGPDVDTHIRVDYNDGTVIDTVVPNTYEGDVYFNHSYSSTGIKTVGIKAWREDEPTCHSGWVETNIHVWAPAPDVPPAIVDMYFTPNPVYIGSYGELYVSISDQFDGDGATVTVDWGHGDFDDPPSPSSSSSSCPKGGTISFDHIFPYPGTFSVKATVSNDIGSHSQTRSVECETYPPDGAPTTPYFENIVINGLPYTEVGQTHTIIATVVNTGNQGGYVECSGYQLNNEQYLGTQSEFISPGGSKDFVFAYETDAANDMKYYFTTETGYVMGIIDEWTEIVLYEPAPPSPPPDDDDGDTTPPSPPPDDDDDDDDPDPPEPPDDDGDPDDPDEGGGLIPPGGKMNTNIDWKMIGILVLVAAIALYVINFKLKNDRFPWQKEKTPQGTYSTDDYKIEVSYADGSTQFFEDDGSV